MKLTKGQRAILESADDTGRIKARYPPGWAAIYRSLDERGLIEWRPDTSRPLGGDDYLTPAGWAAIGRKQLSR
jgi:hypothetical protein